MDSQRTANSQKYLEKEKQKSEGFTLPDLKNYYKATVLKTVWPWHKRDLCDT